MLKQPDKEKPCMLGLVLIIISSDFCSFCVSPGVKLWMERTALMELNPTQGILAIS